MKIQSDFISGYSNGRETAIRDLDGNWKVYQKQRDGRLVLKLVLYAWVGLIIGLISFTFSPFKKSK